MSVIYRCAACGQEHQSRLQGRNRARVEPFLLGGEILEPCSETGQWVRVAPAEARWVDGIEEWGPRPASRLRGRLVEADRRAGPPIDARGPM